MTDPSYQQPAYQPPAGSGPSGPRANFGQRLVAYIVDGIVLGIVYGILLVISRPLAYAVGTLGSLAYFTYFEGSASGQTIGKKLMSIRVIDFSTGSAIGYGRANRHIGSVPTCLARSVEPRRCRPVGSDGRAGNPHVLMTAPQAAP